MIGKIPLFVCVIVCSIDVVTKLVTGDWWVTTPWNWFVLGVAVAAWADILEDLWNRHWWW